MGISELLVQLADPQAIKNLSFMNKMAGGLIVTFLGMGITFLALILLQGIIGLLARFTASTEPSLELRKAPIPAKMQQETSNKRDDDELIAVLSAAVAMKMQKSAGDIAIHHIRRIEEPTPAWNTAGILDQMNMRL